MSREKNSPAAVKFAGIENTTFTQLEMNLVTIGVFSIPKYRDGKNDPRQEKIVKLLDLAEQGLNAKAEILTHRRYGLPTTGDLTLYLAFLQIVHERHVTGRAITNPIEFTHYELMEKARINRSKSKHDKISDWLRRMQNTQIILHGELADKTEEREQIVSVFEQVMIAGTLNGEGVKEKRNKVYLSAWAIKNITETPLIPIDFNTYRQLKNDAAKLLVTHLQVWLYGSKDSHIFQKSYSHFCQLLGYNERRSESKIREQLANAFDELAKYEYISRWEIARAKKGFKVMLWHGKKFHRDLERAFFLIKNPPTDLPLFLANKNTDGGDAASDAAGKANYSDAETRLLERLQSFGMFAELARNLLAKFGCTALTRRAAWAIEILNRTEEKTTVANKGGFLNKIINSQDAVPDSFQTPEESAAVIEADRDAAIAAAEKIEKQIWLEKQFDDYRVREAETGSGENFKKYAADFGKKRELWDAVLTRIRAEYQQEICESWFTPIAYAGFDAPNSRLRLAVQKFAKEWIDSYYPAAIPDALARLGETEIQIEWLDSSRPADETQDAEFFYRQKMIAIFEANNALTLEEFARNQPAELENRFKAEK